MQIEPITLRTADGLRLEGRLGNPPTARGGAVICHPHPLYEGSMSSGFIPVMQREIVAAGWACLRFNFRGVRRSEGAYGEGAGELIDARAALDAVASALPGTPLAVVGWSFGALVGLAAAVADDRVDTCVVVAPPVSVETPIALPPQPSADAPAAWEGRLLAVCGTRDRFCRPDDLRRWTASRLPGAVVETFEGEDHMFSGTRRVEMAKRVARFLDAAIA
ncbi:MAG TPA: alpha/beta fold hydrolase [Actinomycetota bacterium]